MSRRNKGLERKSKGQLRDPRKVFIIATEGSATEPAYFNLLDEHVAQTPSLNSKVKLLTLRRLNLDERDAKTPKSALTSQNSAPDYVLQQLEDFFERNALKPEDELWCVVDRDQWTIRPSAKGLGLKGIARECLKRGYHFCLSNPSFEFWLLLHVKQISDYSEKEQTMLFDGKKSKSGKTPLEYELAKLLSNGYNKISLQAADFIPNLDLAIAQAKSFDTDPKLRWVENHFYTRVYQLVEKIIYP